MGATNRALSHPAHRAVDRALGFIRSIQPKLCETDSLVAPTSEARRRGIEIKRVVLSVTVLIALVIPTGALGDAFYKDYLSSPGAVVELHVKFRNGTPRKVTRFSYANVPYSGGCVAAISDAFKVAIKVNGKGKFHGNAVDHFGRTDTVKGAFKRHDKKIVGNFRVSDAPCDSGKVSYTAKRGG